ncbi:M1 family aminopeptidase [Plantactinospora sp. ZYX-F-223]|uniref:M1 family metallopeptidase n=1 Tax=Plantactinospora sp. ZYX-F-223 TaxID=3144103 RepID=UPI0031FD4FEA
MLRRATLVISTALAVVLAPTPAGAMAAAQGTFSPGAAGAGDPYLPLDGNGGYDVQHYRLEIGYTPATDVLTGVATITSVARQNLSAFNLDLDGLTVRSVTVGGHSARWSRDGGELTVTPAWGVARNATFTTVVRYDGVPQTIDDPAIGTSGFVHTADGMVVAGQPHVAATWFPVNDHPSDKASYTIRITVPDGLTAVSNGVLTGRSSRDGRTTWSWDARQPMASYLATATVGRFDLRAYERDGIRYWDAVDSELTGPVVRPRTGDRLLYSRSGAPGYKRLSRTIDVPADGAQLSFWASLDTPDPGFFFVEAHTVGSDDWTTLPDADGYARDYAGSMCDSIPGTHPFLAHYLSVGPDGTCAPSGTTGRWFAQSSFNYGSEYGRWTVDLAAYAGKRVEVSLSYVTKAPGPADDTTERTGVYLDDLTVSTGAGNTSFEADGDVLDGWTTPGAPAGSPANPNTWAATTVDGLPSAGSVIDRALGRQPEIIEFLADAFGPYPFPTAGAIVDKAPLGFALETQTRPVYSPDFFAYQSQADSVVVHELAHQWFGDALTVRQWRDIWLNEGFATYAEWLWEEHDGGSTPQETFDYYYREFPAESPSWQLKIGDPGAAELLSPVVYSRGAMTLQALRVTVGDAAFFDILRTWTASRAGGTVSTDEFIALAEQISGKSLDEFFAAWLYSTTKPAAPGVRRGPDQPRKDLVREPRFSSSLRPDGPPMRY